MINNYKIECRYIRPDKADIGEWQVCGTYKLLRDANEALKTLSKKAYRYEYRLASEHEEDK